MGETARRILQRIEEGETALTSTLVLCEVAWVLEAMGRQTDIKSTPEKILSFKALNVVGFDEKDLLMEANNMTAYNLDFNDGVNTAIMIKRGISDLYSNDHKHLCRADLLRLIFE